jgi:aminoglycoside phosphotransferase (APT) family kinase protein
MVNPQQITEPASITGTTVATLTHRVVGTDSVPAVMGPEDAASPTAMCEDSDDASSETSTIRYDHEPFETFKDKVRELVAEKLNVAVNNIHIKRMTGGSSNRVVGVEVHAPGAKRQCFSWLQKWIRAFQRSHARTTSQAYIVRMSRYDCSELEQQVATLQVVRARVSFPIPEVVHYDLSSNNVLEKPYMIQRHIPGSLITHLLKDLPLEQKKSITKQVTALVSAIATIKAAPGDISVDNLASSVDAPVCVTKIKVPQGDSIVATPQTSIAHLIEQCETWRDFQSANGYCFDEIWDSFVAISKALDKRGFLNGDCVLVHGDLREYNMLAEKSDSVPLQITGIIDWDDAYFAPLVMAFRSPFWLWTSEDASTDVLEDEKNALLEPTTEEDRILKDIFLEYASGEYKRYAFAPEAMLARRMYHILRKGIFGDWDMMEAEAIIREWDDLHPEDDVAMLGDESDDHDSETEVDLERD